MVVIVGQWTANFELEIFLKNKKVPVSVLSRCDRNSYDCEQEQSNAG
jgi:hypothetical protein